MAIGDKQPGNERKVEVKSKAENALATTSNIALP
jgi:hypothetical protein